MSDERVPPPTALPGVITAPLSWLYSIGINKRNRGFDRGRGVTRIDRPVISIGNLSTGGTGKTPMVHLIVRMLLDAGKRPVIAMRGYGAKPGQKGDEQLEHEQALPGIPVVAQPDRLDGLRRLFSMDEGGEIDCVVLDDGFQHRKIARDLDIVLIDATRPPDRDALLPRGHLRDPIGSLRRAHIVILTHSELADASELERLRELLAAHAPGVPVLAARHAWVAMHSYVRVDAGWDATSVPISDMDRQVVQCVCGIGNSDAFERMVLAAGMKIDRRFVLSDHEPLNDRLLRELTSWSNSSQFSPIIMTRKDWVKANPLSGWPQQARVYVPELSMEIEGEGELKNAVQELFGLE